MKQEFEAVVLTVMLPAVGCVQKTPPLQSTVTNGQDEIAGKVTTESVILQSRLTTRGGWVDGDLPGAPSVACFDNKLNNNHHAIMGPSPLSS